MHQSMILGGQTRRRHFVRVGGFEAVPPPLAPLILLPVREGWTSAMIHFVLLIVCAAAIYLSCEWFVNAVEWLGERLNVGKVAVGTILAAFGTALADSGGSGRGGSSTNNCLNVGAPILSGIGVAGRGTASAASSDASANGTGGNG
jgi:hypothetical protein